MIHKRQSHLRCPAAQGHRRAFALAAVALAAWMGAGCGDDGRPDPDSLRFGQLGRMEIHLESPLRLGEGVLRQSLQWSSTGAWSLRESISYRGLVGDETFTRSPGDPAVFASAYASLITAVNEVEEQKLFTPELPPTLSPECGPTRTRLTFVLRDEVRNETVTWIRCAEGSLGSLVQEGAGPDPGAARLVLATLLARESTVGARWTSTYLGSVPFGTLDRGEDSGSIISAPVTFIDARGFGSFWAEHAPGRPIPAVDFSREMVVAALVGVRREAGDSVEVRRILQVDQGTLIEAVERVPGNFCSPAARTHVPFHLVVAPRTPVPHRFADIRVERVSCGA